MIRTNPMSVNNPRDAAHGRDFKYIKKLSQAPKRNTVSCPSFYKSLHGLTAPYLTDSMTVNWSQTLVVVSYGRLTFLIFAFSIFNMLLNIEV